METIEFFDDEDAELPPPLTKRDVIAMNKQREYMQVRKLVGQCWQPWLLCGKHVTRER